MFFVLLMYFCIAGAFTVSKTALQYADPAFLIGLRMIISGIIMLGYLYFFNKSELNIKKEDWLSFFLLACAGIYLPYIAEFWAMKHGISSIKASLLFNLSPFVTTLMAYVTLNETLSRRQWLGLIIGFLGAIPVLFTGEQEELIASNWWIISLPDLAILFSVVMFAQNWVLVKRLVKSNYAPPLINGCGMLGGGLLALISSFFIEKFPPVVASSTEQGSAFYIAVTSYIPAPYAAIFLFGLCISYLIFITNIFAYNLYGYLLHSYTATFLSFAGLTIPVFAGILGWFFRGEEVSWNFLISVLLVFIGLFIFYKDELKITITA